MALDLSKLQRVGSQNDNAPVFWTYNSGADAIATVDGSGYFNNAADRLNVGDLIYVKPTSGTPGFLWVNANTRDLTATPPVEGVVDTSNQLALTSTDSD